jgi:hypothetical protein
MLIRNVSKSGHTAAFILPNSFGHLLRNQWGVWKGYPKFWRSRETLTALRVWSETDKTRNLELV